MNNADSAIPLPWQKSADGYTIVDPKWGANLTLHTKESKTEEELNALLQFFYQNAKAPLRKGGNYALIQPA